MDPMRGVDEDERKRPVIFQALRTALGRPPIWLACWLLAFLPALVLALPWLGALRDAIGHGQAPGAVTFDLGEIFEVDHARELGTLRSGTAVAAAAFSLIVVLLGAFTAGGWLQILLERTHGESTRRFLLGGARYFWRFVRVAVVSLLWLALLGWLVYDMPWKRFVLGGLLDVPAWDRGDLETLGSESAAIWLGRLQALLYMAGFAFVRVWGDFTRTRMAFDDSRSAVIAGIATFFLLLRRPLRTLGPMASLFGLQFALLLVLALLASWFDGSQAAPPGLVGIAVLAVLAQAGAIAREIFRGASYGVAVRVTGDLVTPAQSSSVSDSLGGPGGPRYPIDDVDEFGIAM